jgi:hypothetical protein
MAEQSRPPPAMHEPLRQVSSTVQKRPSSQDAPFGIGVAKQPDVGLQASAVQGSPSLQTTGVPPQTPAVHTSLDVHAFPSVQLVPLATGTLWQPSTASQESAVQVLPSSQTSGVPLQSPKKHESPVVQMSLSLQG